MIDRTDFYEDVKPWLKKLEDDPDRPTPTIKTTTITGEAIEIEGEISPLDDGEIPSQYQTKVDQGDAEAARSVRPMAGLDILAFYKSFRFIDRHPLPGNWGVFILDAGLEGLAQDLVVLKPNLPLEELRIFSKRVLLAHELYHFWTDAWALGQEIMPLLTKYKRYDRPRETCSKTAGFFGHFQVGSSPTSTLNHFPEGSRAPRDVSLRQSCIWAALRFGCCMGSRRTMTSDLPDFTQP